MLDLSNLSQTEMGLGCSNFPVHYGCVVNVQEIHLMNSTIEEDLHRVRADTINCVTKMLNVLVPVWLLVV